MFSLPSKKAGGMSLFKNLFGGSGKIEKVDLTKRFDLISRIGQGSMSKVWRARDTMSGRIVALKVLDKEKTAKLDARFVGLNRPTEGEMSVRLNHPFIVRTFEHGITTDNEQFLVMEFLEGYGLSFLIDMQNEVMRENRLRLMIELGQAIDYLHRNEWIHRDLCPRNVLIDDQKHIKVIDFGLAVPNTPDFQKPGNRTGTAAYMAPELIRRQRTDQRIDIFSYAVTCYEMFTKRNPWEVGTAIASLEAAMQRLNTSPRDIRELVPKLDDNLADIIMRGVEINPDDRWQKVGDMVNALGQARQRLEGVRWKGTTALDDDDEYEDVSEYQEVAEDDGYEDVSDAQVLDDEDEYEDVGDFEEYKGD